MRRLLLGTLIATSLAVMTESLVVAAGQEAEPASQAWFEDHWIDLSVDWEQATACDVRPDITVCFRTEAELDAGQQNRTAAQAVALLSTCGSALRLYDGTSYSGTVLSLSTRNTPLNLSTYGFDNQTSSYKVGACDSDLFSAANQGGTLYSGNTAAFAQATSMLSGWNNVVSSVYIY